MVMTSGMTALVRFVRDYARLGLMALQAKPPAHAFAVLPRWPPFGDLHNLSTLHKPKGTQGR
jgi:hypothetical protein